MKLFASLLLFALVSAAAAGYLFYLPIGPPAGTPDDRAVYVDIASGSGTKTIATRLQRAGAIRSRFAFYILRAIQGGTLRAGEYRFNHPARATEIYARIVRGDVYTVPLTIPEGYNIFDIAQAVETAGFASREDFLAAERSQTALIADLSPHAPSLEGYLFPDTYRLSRHATATQILAAMVRRFRQAAAQLSLKSDIPRTVTMASLIEKEVSQDSERPLVAGVFVNRLARDMPLETDPTVIYAALLDGRYRGTIYASDLKSDSPYNTYRHAGLPPGPIANPGMAALRAAIAPAATDYLYFVSDANGHTRFSATLKEHSGQVEEYRQAARRPVPAKNASRSKSASKRPKERIGNRILPHRAAVY